MRFARGSLIFCYGLFTIAAQTLLFREFMATFEGNDISVGVFFGSWFLWVGVGAIVAYRAGRFRERLVERIQLAFLAYLPAFVLELILIVHMRELAGVESYALLSVKTILLWSTLVNAPVSIVTGALFPLACRWVQTLDDFPVSRVYILEAAGSFVGGLGVTLLLAFGASLARVFFILALVMSVSAFISQLSEPHRKGQESAAKLPGCVLSLLLFVGVCICLVYGADKALMQYLRAMKWSRLLPRDALVGSFQTAQAEYLYGQYQGQWVAIREGSVCEILPDSTTAGQTAAVVLCQKPDARRVLVVGSGLGLCRQFLRLAQVEAVHWSNPDGRYVQLVNEFIEPQFKVQDERFCPLAGDIRAVLAGREQCYDIVIVNLPGASSSVLNRYYTVEFYRLVKAALRPGGVLAVGVAGGENVMGTELVNLGAATKATLELAFAKLVLTPGDHTWFIASDSDALTGDPAILRDRFAGIQRGSEIFSPQGLLSVYLPDRAAAAMESYLRADLPPHLLINRDARPLTYLYSLLVAAKESGSPVARLVRLLALAGPMVLLVPIAVFVALRVIFVFKTEGGYRRSGFDASFLVFSAGSVGIGVDIVLMYLYQTRFGSLYLHIGVISSLFMMGLTLGAVAARRLLSSHVPQDGSGPPHTQILLLAVLLVHSLLTVAIALWFTERWTGRYGVSGHVWEPVHVSFAVAFVLCGLCCGCYFPIAAKQLAEAGFEVGRAGSRLEMADHLGASVGGLATSLVLIPVLGTRMTLFVSVVLVLANLPMLTLALRKSRRINLLETTGLGLHKLGYVLFGVGASIVLCSNLLAAAGARARPALPEQEAAALAGQLHIERVSAVLKQTGREINYFKVFEADGRQTGYVFSSEDLAAEVRGFAGRMNLAVLVDADGKLVNFHIVRSNETPSYLELLRSWYDSLKGRGLFAPEPFAGVDAVTGATVSSKAVLSALRISGQRFAADVLGRKVPHGAGAKTNVPVGGLASYMPDAGALYLIGVFVLALFVSYWGGFWSRLVVLFVTFLVGGVLLNAQYSSEQIVTLLSMNAPAARATGVFLLVLGVPIMVIVFGNIYCGYICPFGALQELLGHILPERFKPATSAGEMQKARFMKYIVLFVLIVVFFLSRNRTTLAADPLISVFSLRFSLQGLSSAMTGWQSLAAAIVVAALVGALLYERFWCRYLCPVGAFLSLLNNLAILKRYLPAKRFGNCEFGCTTTDHLDCISCDRCRHRKRAVLRQEPDAGRAATSRLGRGLVVSVLAVGLLVSAASVKRFTQVIPLGSDSTAGFISTAGQSRDVDLQRIKTLIEQKKLSEHEAEFYKKVE